MDMTEAVRTVFQRAWRWLLLFLLVLAVAGLGIGYLVAGMPGLWGALLGLGLAALFSGTTVGTMYATARSAPTTTAIVVLGSWLVKMALIIVALVLLGDQTFYSKPALAIVLVIGALGSAYLDFIAVTKTRVPYIEPASMPAAVDDEAAIPSAVTSADDEVRSGSADTSPEDETGNPAASASDR